MSCYTIFYRDGAKVMRPVQNRQEYLRLRNDSHHVQRVEAVRRGQTGEKRRLLQFNYSCIPGEDGLLKGCQTPSTTFGMDIDHVPPLDMQALGELIVESRQELGLLMLERSVRGEGYHLVMRRRPGLTQEENLRWASDLIGVPFDEGAKDITRVFFATTASEEDLIYLEEELFQNENANGSTSQQVNESTSARDFNENPSSSIINPSPLTINPSSPQGSFSGIPYPMLVESLQELMGGAPAHGSRNNFIFSMAAYLRYVCNDDPEWIAQVLPTYGEERDKWRRTIESACQRSQYKQMPQIVRRAIDLARQRHEALKQGDSQAEATPPAMPRRLPRLIAHLVKNVPEVCRPAVANAVFPSLAAHLSGVKFWLIDGTEKEATFMCVTMAPQSSGKSAVNKPIEYITADIVERDELNRRREQEWKDATTQKGANKEKPRRPDDLCVQVLVSDMTNAAFVQRMKDAGGRYLYTNLEELDLLRQLQTNGTKDVGKIICLCFDNGKYGQERVGTQSVTARVDLRWNWNASSTVHKGQQFFQGRLVDGTLSRLNICTIVPDASKPFVYGKYDEEYARQLKPYIANLNLAHGHIECPQALKMARSMEEQCAEQAALMDDEALQVLAHRAVTIAYLKAMVLFIAHDMTWSREIEDFARWSLQYDLWCKHQFFGEQLVAEKAKEYVKQPRGRQNMLDQLPNTFSRQDVLEVRRLGGKDAQGCQSMIRSWLFRGYIEHDATQDVYIKTPKYLHRNEKA